MTIKKALQLSIEWRLIAASVTTIYFYALEGTWVKATLLSLVLQGILFVVQVLWMYLREKNFLPNK